MTSAPLTSATQVMLNKDWEKIFNERDDDSFYTARDMDSDTAFNMDKSDIMDMIEKSFDNDDGNPPPISSGAKDYMMTGNPNTQKKYRKIWCEYESWCSGKGWAPNQENVLINYMHDQLQDGELGVGSIWNTYSAINSTIRQNSTLTVTLGLTCVSS